VPNADLGEGIKMAIFDVRSPVLAGRGNAMLMKKTRILMLVVAAVAIAAAGFAGERQGPRIYVQESNFDFGTVKPGSQPEHIFEIKNVGDEVLDIQRVQPT
jgi:hypothetical protein